MKSILSILLVGCLCFPLIAQNNVIRGMVLLQNSGGQPVEGVKITSFGTSPSYSNSSGIFELRFPSKIAGDKIRLFIDASSQAGKNLQTINKKELASLRIPSDPDDDPILIIVCPASQFEEAALRYYGILAKATNKNYESRLSNIEQQLERKNLDAETTAKLIQQLDALRDERDEAINKVEEQAQFIAAINKDQASQLVKMAIQKIEEEENVEDALAILDNSKLDEAYQMGLTKKMQGEKEMRQAIEGYELKISLLLPRFKYEEAIQCYKNILQKEESYNFKEEEKADYHAKISTLYKENGEYQKAFTFRMKALNLLEKIEQTDTVALAESYQELGNIQIELTNFSEGIASHQKGVLLLEQKLEPNDPDLAKAYTDIATAHSAYFQYNPALNYSLKAINILESTKDSVDLALAEAYLAISEIYSSLDRSEKSLEYKEKGLIVQQRELGAMHPDLAMSYQELALTYFGLDAYDRAHEEIRKALDINQKVLHPNHPTLALNLVCDGLINTMRGQFDEASENIAKGEEIMLKNFGPDHLNMSVVLMMKGMNVLHQGDTLASMEYFLQAEKIIDDDEFDFLRSVLFDVISLISFVQGNYDQALAYRLKTLAIWEKMEQQETASPKGFKEEMALANVTQDVVTKTFGGGFSHQLVEDYYQNHLAQNYNYLGVIYNTTGDYEASITYYTKALEVCLVIFDKNDPFIALLYSNLGYVHENLGNTERALEYGKKAVETLEANDKAEPQDVAEANDQMVYRLQALSRAEESLRYARAAKDIWERISPGTAELAESYHTMSYCYQALNIADVDSVEYYGNKAVELWEKLEGDFRDQLSLAHFFRGFFYQQIFQFEPALEYYEKCIQICNEKEAVFTYQLGYSYLNLGIINQYFVQSQEALEHFLDAERLLGKITDPNSYDWIQLQNRIGQLQANLGNFDLAIPRLNLVLQSDIFKTQMSPAEQVGVYRSLGDSYRSKEQYEEGLKNHELGLQLAQEASLTEDYDLGLFYNNASLSYMAFGQYEQMAALCEEAKRIWLQVLPADAYELSTCYGNLFIAYKGLGQVEKGIEFLNQAIAIQKVLLGEDHPDVGLSYLNMMYAYQDLRDYDNAILYGEKAVTLLPKDKTDYIDALNAIGLSYYYKDDFSAALSYYEKAYALAKDYYGGIYLNNAGMALVKSDRLDEAKGCFEQLQALLPENGIVFRDWALYYTVKGEIDLAFQNLEKAISLGYSDWNWIQFDRFLEPLRQDKRYKALLDKQN